MKSFFGSFFSSLNGDDPLPLKESFAHISARARQTKEIIAEEAREKEDARIIEALSHSTEYIAHRTILILRQSDQVGMPKRIASRNASLNASITDEASDEISEETLFELDPDTFGKLSSRDLSKRQNVFNLEGLRKILVALSVEDKKIFTKGLVRKYSTNTRFTRVSERGVFKRTDNGQYVTLLEMIEGDYRTAITPMGTTRRTA